MAGSRCATFRRRRARPSRSCGVSARDDILAGIRVRRQSASAASGRARTQGGPPAATVPPRYRAPFATGDLVASFAAKAQAANTEIRLLDSEADVSEAVADLLRAYNRAAR